MALGRKCLCHHPPLGGDPMRLSDGQRNEVEDFVRKHQANVHGIYWRETNQCFPLRTGFDMH